MHFSENEDEEDSEEEGEEESDEDEEEEDVDEEDIEDDDEELEDEEHSYDEEEEDEDNFARGVNLGIQTSPGLDDTVDSGNLNGGEGARFRGTGGSGPSRFISSTPAPSVKSTSAYFSTPQPHPDSNLGNNGKGKPAFSVNSPLRRHVAGNERAFDSLGEELASLPMSGPRSSFNNPSALPTPSYS